MPRLLLVLPVVLVASLQAVAQPPKLDPPKPFDINDWTPRPATGQAEPWEKMRDPQWDDARFRGMNTGPALNATFQSHAVDKDKFTVYKGTAIRLGKDGEGVIFDRNALNIVARWEKGWLNHSVRRFGLLNTPSPVSPASFGNPSPGWVDPNDVWSKLEPDAKPPGSQFDPKYDRPRYSKGYGVTLPLPKSWGRYEGMYLHGDRVVLKYNVHGTTILDAPRFEGEGDKKTFSRTLSVGPTKDPIALLTSRRFWTVSESLLKTEKKVEGVLPISEGVWTLLPTDKTRTGTVSFSATETKPEDLATLTKPGPARWGKPLVTKLVKGDETGPFAVDTLTIPYDNPHKALFFCTGLDFLPDGRIAVCTCHGDVWLVKVDEAKGECHWQRFATGLYHPLGLKVVDKKIVVLERGQLTRLHDTNDDGEADFYECVCNDWHTGSGEHSYDTCLETDPHGNFYFFKTGDTHLAHGGCLLKVSKDGGKVETFATGFRHPIGLGMSPTGIVTGADQEGNWMPATRVDQYKAGGFYGDMRAAHRNPLPITYDGPLCWIPREVDNSAGGQTWVPASGDSPWAKSPLAGLPIHFSYGRCRPFVLLRQEFKDGTVQGGVAPLDIKFLSGVCRGRFHPTDGNMYVCGLNGWQTAAQKDGCLQRVRLTGKPLDTVAKHEVTEAGVTLTFTRPLDKKAAENPANYKAAQWNYRWSEAYGSKRWKVSNGLVEGQDDLVIASAKLLGEKTVAVTFAGGAKPAMQLQVGYNVTADDGAAVAGSVFLTVHKTK